MWIAALFSSELGTAVLAFAITWTASGYGADTAAAVFTLTVTPPVLFGLLGGALADRFGPRKIMVASCAGMATTAATSAVIAATAGVVPALLLVTATSIGTAGAFFRPSSTVFARHFVADDELGTAMVRAGMAGQLARSIGPPLGGMLLGVLSLTGAAWLAAAGATAALLTLLMIHPPRRHHSAYDAATARGIADAVVAARSRRGVPALLAAVAIVAGVVIPVVVLGIPVIARERGWSAIEAGLIEAGWIAGGLFCSALFAWRGPASKAWRPMFTGPGIIVLGLELLAMTPLWIVAMSSTVLVGAGVVTFTAHAFPTYTLLAPSAMVSRFHSLLLLVQQAPQLLMTPLIGLFVASTGTGPAIAAFGMIPAYASLVVARNRRLREFRL